MGRDRDRGGLERLLGERGQDLMRAAVALTGSRADGEDLLQAALERLLRNWRRVDTDPEGYLRRTLYNLAADGLLTMYQYLASQDISIADIDRMAKVNPAKLLGLK